MSADLTPKEVRALWADDLENGGHKQGRGRLYTPGGGWCCMGRLQDLAFDHGVIERRQLSGQTHPDLAVVAWAGIRTESGTYTSDDGYTNELTDDNDSGKTFAQIAAIIRAEPEGLCVA